MFTIWLQIFKFEMYKVNWVLTGAIFGFLGVALGAFGAHGLENILSQANLERWNTAVLYNLIHAVIIVALGLKGEKFVLPCLFFSIGILLFSFSLYLYSLTSIKLFAMITPFGGLSFLAGWVFLMIKSFNKNV